MKKVILIVLMLVSASGVFCQTVEDSVKKVVNKLFVAMKTSDRSMLLDCFADSVVLQTIIKNRNGKVSVRNEEVMAFADQVEKLEKGSADERITFETVKVDADLASVWTPYKFYYKGSFSHCGVNSFQLIRINGLWKIQYIIDTRRKDKCA